MKGRRNGKGREGAAMKGGERGREIQERKKEEGGKA